MAYKYYVAVDGQPSGPFMKEELISRGITRDTLLWREGMPQWQPAGSYPELADLFTTTYGGYQQPVYGNIPQTAHGYNWLPWAIIATVCGFFFSCIGAIFGIFGIVYANKATNYYAHGLQNAGDDANSTAKTMTIIALIVAAVGVISSIVLLAKGITTLALLQNLR